MYSPMFERMGAITGLIATRCSPQQRDQTVAEHGAVYQAIAAHDPAAARSAMDLAGPAARRGRRTDGCAPHWRRSHSDYGGDAAEKELARRDRARPGARRMWRRRSASDRVAPPRRCSTPTGCFRPTSRRARSPGASTRKCATCRSSRRTVTPIRAGTPRTPPFPDPARLFVIPDHYIFRMLYSQGVTLEEMGIPRKEAAQGRDRRAQDLAHVRRALLSVPRHADAAVARSGLRRTVRHDGAPLERDRRPLFRPHLRSAWRSRNSGPARCSSSSRSK